MDDRLSSAYARCRSLARRHYENFPVGRFGVPSPLRRHIHAIYAFARTADDFADEPEWEGNRLPKLEEWGRLLEDCPRTASANPVFLALGNTINELGLPIQLFRDLLDAFRQDAVKQRYASRSEVLDYCRRSANPIGRLVLLTCGYRDSELFRMSDALCTALQLTNFWQDLSVDHPRGRSYLPLGEARLFRVDVEELVRGNLSGDTRSLLEALVNWTRTFYRDSRGLAAELKGMLRAEIGATWGGGALILHRTSLLGVDALKTRPRLSGLDKAVIVGRGLWRLISR